MKNFLILFFVLFSVSAVVAVGPKLSGTGLDMGGYIVSNAANGTASGEYVTYQQLIDNHGPDQVIGLDTDYNAKYYDYAISASTVIDPYILAACDKMPNGGVVKIGPGSFTAHNILVGNRDNITIQGSGAATSLVSDSATLDVLFFGGNSADDVSNNCIVRDLQITSGVDKTAGYAINCTYTSYFRAENVEADSQAFNHDASTYYLKNGFLFKYFNYNTVRACTIYADGTGIAICGKSDGTWGAGLTISGGNKISTGTGAGKIGIHIGGSAGGVAIDQTDVIVCGTGIKVDKSLVAVANREFWLGPTCFIDSSDSGLEVSELSDRMNVIGGWYAGMAGRGMNITSSNWPEVTIVGANIKDNDMGGVYLNHVSAAFSGCSITGNGVSGSSSHGVSLGPAMTVTCSVTGNSIHNNCGYGVTVDGSANHYVISSNMVGSNLLGGVNAATSSTEIVDNNCL